MMNHRFAAWDRVVSTLIERNPVFLRRKPKAKGARHMKPHPKPTADVPKWAYRLVEAVTKPGLIREAYQCIP